MRKQREKKNKNKKKIRNKERKSFLFQLKRNKIYKLLIIDLFF